MRTITYTYNKLNFDFYVVVDLTIIIREKPNNLIGALERFREGDQRKWTFLISGFVIN